MARLPRGVVVVDRELKIDYLNAPAARLLEDLGAPVPDLPLPLDTDEVPLRRIARELFAPDAPPLARLARVGKRTLKIEGVPANGCETVVLVVEDVTEQERARTAEHNFIENAAHELRTPLAAIVSVVEALDAGAKDDPQARDRFLSHLRGHSERLARLATSLLALARVQSGQQEPRVELVAIAPILGRIAGELEPRSGVDVHVRAPTNVAALTDPELVHHALRNLAANAVKNTFSGEIVLAANVSGRSLELVVRDSGRGMSAADFDRAFERFHRGDGSEGGGFGLGLAIARDAIEAVGGTITLEREAGGGVCAKIELPGVIILR